jgi:hypothetical protein
MQKHIILGKIANILCMSQNKDFFDVLAVFQLPNCMNFSRFGK